MATLPMCHEGNCKAIVSGYSTIFNIQYYNARKLIQNLSFTVAVSLIYRHHVIIMLQLYQLHAFLSLCSDQNHGQLIKRKELQRFAQSKYCMHISDLVLKLAPNCTSNYITPSMDGHTTILLT